MRIISGKHKSRRIVAPKNLPVRPTTDFAKEALFNILNNTVLFTDIMVLDLYAGTGNISYEFASRGARKVSAVDENINCVKFIEKTAAFLDLPIGAFKSEVGKFLLRTNDSFDIIFADPPYDFTLEQLYLLADTIFDKRILKENGLFILEHSKYKDLSGHPHFQSFRKYGNVAFNFFANNNSDSEIIQ